MIKSIISESNGVGVLHDKKSMNLNIRKSKFNRFNRLAFLGLVILWVAYLVPMGLVESQ